MPDHIVQAAPGPSSSQQPSPQSLMRRAQNMRHAGRHGRYSHRNCEKLYNAGIKCVWQSLQSPSSISVSSKVITRLLRGARNDASITFVSCEARAAAQSQLTSLEQLRPCVIRASGQKLAVFERAARSSAASRPLSPASCHGHAFATNTLINPDLARSASTFTPFPRVLSAATDLLSMARPAAPNWLWPKPLASAATPGRIPGTT